MALVGALAGWTSAAVGRHCAAWQLLAGTARSLPRDSAINTPFEGNGNTIPLFWACPGLIVVHISHL